MDKLNVKKVAKNQLNCTSRLSHLSHSPKLIALIEARLTYCQLEFLVREHIVNHIEAPLPRP